MKTYDMYGPLNPVICNYPWEQRAKVYSGTFVMIVPLGTTLDQINWIRPQLPTFTDTWIVPGSTGTPYTVRLKSGLYTCTCPGFKFGKGKGKNCKHIKQIIGETK